MLISNKSIIDLKVLSKTEASYCLQKSEVCSRQGAGLWHTGRYLQLCRSQRPKVPQSKRYGSSVDILFSCPYYPCISVSQTPPPRQVLFIVARICS